MTTAPNAEESGSNVQTFSVPDMSCQHCIDSITGTVSPLDGVSAVVVDLEAKVVTVTGGHRDAIVAAIDDAGFDTV